MSNDVYRWRKATDIDREYAMFELMTDDDVVACVGFSDDGSLELVIYDGLVGKLFELSNFEELLRLGRSFAEGDR